MHDGQEEPNRHGHTKSLNAETLHHTPPTGVVSVDHARSPSFFFQLNHTFPWLFWGMAFVPFEKIEIKTREPIPVQEVSRLLEFFHRLRPRMASKRGKPFGEDRTSLPLHFVSLRRGG